MGAIQMVAIGAAWVLPGSASGETVIGRRSFGLIKAILAIFGMKGWRILHHNRGLVDDRDSFCAAAIDIGVGVRYHSARAG
jgi:hypothetical protein